MTDAAIDAAARLLGVLAQRDAPLGARTTYRVGGTAALLVEANAPNDLVRVRTAVLETNVAVLVLGRGSNLLVADAGFAGIVVLLGESFARVEPHEPGVNQVHAGGAAPLPVVARAAAAAGIGGLEWMVGIPGSVGGAVRMNAGGHGSDVAACLGGYVVTSLIGAADGERTLTDLDAGYRHSSVRSTDVVSSATFVGHAVEAAEAEAAIAEIVRWRRANQPGGQNAGSVFTNPEGDSAGRIIEAAGLKGLRIGSAEVSAKHANFIQADPGGSADDVRALIAEVQRRVRDATGMELRTEVRMIGFSS